MTDLIVFDLETQYLAAEVGGWNNKELLRVAVACTWDEDNSYRVWFEPQAGDLIEELQAAETIVGYNTNAFDFQVLSLYGDTRRLESKSFDILSEIRTQGAPMVSLNTVAGINLGEAKALDTGASSIKLWRTGRVDELTAYCQRDVELTRRLFERWETEGILWVSEANYVVWPGVVGDE